MIELRNISKTYATASGHVQALDQINLQVAAGEICGVIGRSGAGKSTLIRCVNLLERPTTGEVIVDGQHLLELSPMQLRQARHNIGMVFQHFNLLASRTVFQNVAFQLELLGKSKDVIEKTVMSFLELTGLVGKRDSYPSQLSGGQKQRVAIARALVTNPKVLLCDEMTSSLDPETTRSILDLIKRINRELKLSILLITHEMQVIKLISDHVAVIDGGRIVENADVVSLFKNPTNDVARQFIQGDLHAHIPEELRQQLTHDPLVGGRTLIQIAFIGKTATQPVIESLVKRAKVHVNILQANLEFLRSETIGIMTITLQGESADCDEAIAFLRKLELKVEVLGYVS